MTLEICDFCKEIGNADSNYYKYLKFILLPEKCPMDPVSTSFMIFYRNIQRDYEVEIVRWYVASICLLPFSLRYCYNVGNNK